MQSDWFEMLQNIESYVGNDEEFTEMLKTMQKQDVIRFYAMVQEEETKETCVV